MNIKRIPTSLLLSICFVGLVLIITVIPVHAFVSTWGGTAIGPLLIWKSWKEILLVALLIIFLVWLARDLTRFKDFFRDRFVALTGMYAVLTLISGLILVGDNGQEATAAGVVMNLRYPLIALLGYGVFKYAGIGAESWKKWATHFLIIAGTAIALLGIVQVTLVPKEFLTMFGYDKQATIAPYILIDDNPDALRAFATLRGPNDFGAYLILPLILAIQIARSRRQYLLPVGVIVVGIAVSGSRSAWIGALVAVATSIILTAGKKILMNKKAVVGMAVGLASMVALFYAAINIPAVRLAVFHSSPTDSSLTEGSTDAHWSATAEGIDRVLVSPVGCGPGCAGPASYYGDDPRISENYYVQIAEEVGISGLLLWLMMAAVVARRLYYARADYFARALVASGIGLSLVGFWLHVWSDDPLSLTWWGLAGMVLGVLATTQTGKKSKKLVS